MLLNFLVLLVLCFFFSVGRLCMIGVVVMVVIEMNGLWLFWFIKYKFIKIIVVKLDFCIIVILLYNC